MSRVSPYQFENVAEAYGYDADYIRAIFLDAKKISEKNLPVLFTLNHLALATGCHYKILHSIVERKANPYHCFAIPKKTGGLRLISSPSPALFDVQKFIKQEILDAECALNEVHSAVYSYKKGVSIVDNARKHVGSRWLIKVDIKDFFGSITEDAVYSFFSSLGYANLLSFEIARLVTWPPKYQYVDEPISFEAFQNNFNYNHNSAKFGSTYRIYTNPLAPAGSLPQGSPTSPQLSNILFSSVDIALKGISDKHQCIYTRYADDLFFSCNKMSLGEAQDLLKKVQKILSKFGYVINKEKTKILSPQSKKIITGIVIEDNALRLDKKYKDAIKRDVFFAEKNGIAHQGRLCRSKNPLSFLEYLSGRINYAQQVEPMFARKWQERLRCLVEKNNFINKQFYVQKNK